MTDKLTEYRRAESPLPDHNVVWPLYGAGFENLGKDGQPIEVPMPTCGPDELLVRHDACGLCFSDIKVIKLGQEHPRIYRKMNEDPVVLGHEVTMVVVGIGENLKGQYHIGDRFIIQADVYSNGVGYAYGYEIHGGLSKYGLIDQRVLHGDEGNYLLPVKPTTGYAASALTEPWACVTAAYTLKYRTGLKPGGTAWIIGANSDGNLPYTIGTGFDAASHPDYVLLSHVPQNFAAWLQAQAAKLGVEVMQVDDLANPPIDKIDDIILLGSDPDIVEQVSPRLTNGGVFAIVSDKPMARPVSLDVGRIHYSRWVYVGGSNPDIAQAYSEKPVRAALKPGGRAWFLGAAGPMGRMHVQRAIQIADGPTTIVCTDVSEHRLEDLRMTFAPEAEAKGIEFICLNPSNEAAAQQMASYKTQGFDDIIVLAPVPKLISDAATYLAPDGVLNIFAGVARGMMATLDLSDVVLKGARYIGQSGSLIEDLRITLNQSESGVLSPNRAVAAVGSLSAVRDGLQAVQDATFSGKVVIFPHIKEMPLTPLEDLKDKLPTVYAKLKDGREWTVEAEDEFLRLMLP